MNALLTTEMNRFNWIVAVTGASREEVSVYTWNGTNLLYVYESAGGDAALVLQLTSKRLFLTNDMNKLAEELQKYEKIASKSGGIFLRVHRNDL